MVSGIDVVIGIIVLLSIIIGLFRGFIREALSLVSWAIALWLALRFYTPVSSFFSGVIHSLQLRAGLAFILIFATALFIGTLIGHLITLFVKKSGLSGTDRILGVFFGMGRGVLVVSLCLLVMSFTSFKSATYWQESALVPLFQPMMAWLKQTVPTHVKKIETALSQPTMKTPKAADSELGVAMVSALYHQG